MVLVYSCEACRRAKEEKEKKIRLVKSQSS